MSPAIDEALTGETVQGFEGVTAGDRSDSASDAADRKAFATLQAKLALKEVSLVRMADGVMYASRWGQIVMLADVAKAQALLDKLGGAR